MFLKSLLKITVGDVLRSCQKPGSVTTNTPADVMTSCQNILSSDATNTAGNCPEVVSRTPGIVTKNMSEDEIQRSTPPSSPSPPDMKVRS